MQKLVIFLVSFTVFNCVSRPSLTGGIAKNKSGNKLYKAACPVQENDPVQPVNSRICKELMMEEQDGFQYTYGAAMPITGNYY